MAKRSAKDTLGSNIYNDFTSNDARNFEKAEKAKFDDTVGPETPNTKKVALRMARCPRKIYWNWQIKSTNSIMKEVKIEYNKILLPFCCGLTAFSNLLQRKSTLDVSFCCCGLTAFSNLLQRPYKTIKNRSCCGLTAFSNLLQQNRATHSKKLGCGLTAFSNLLQRQFHSRSGQQSCGLTAFSNLLQPMST